jgi:phage-related minor tail protein
MVAIVVLAFSFAIPGGAEMWRAVAPVVFGLLILGALVAGIVAAVRPRRRH